jgi:hypothetical protein
MCQHIYLQTGALRELGVALCRGNASLCRSGAYVATLAAGRAQMRGLARPSAEVVSACLSPCVWFWGFWFGFALRCIALLCGVFVRLRLAFFSAGGGVFFRLCIHMRGLARPSAEVVSACLSPCVWFWGFWFGFAWRRVALLCGVFVR